MGAASASGYPAGEGVQVSEEKRQGGEVLATMTAYDLWRAWYAMEDRKPVGTVGEPAYDAWTAQCAMIYSAARAAEERQG